MIPYVYKDGKIFFYHRAKDGETQRYCDKVLLIHGTDPDKYTFENNQVVPVSQELADQLDAASQAVLVGEMERLAEIEQARVSSTLNRITVAAATDYIAAQLDTASLDALAADLNNAEDFASFKTAVIAALTDIRQQRLRDKAVWLQALPYLLKKSEERI